VPDGAKRTVAARRGESGGREHRRQLPVEQALRPRAAVEELQRTGAEGTGGPARRSPVGDVQRAGGRSERAAASVIVSEPVPQPTSTTVPPGGVSRAMACTSAGRHAFSRIVSATERS
jgi:hypothetical protein